MIGPDDVLTVEWLDLDDVCFGEAQACDWSTVEHYARLMAAAAPGSHLAPPLVRPHPARPGRYALRDGKHRYLAHLVIGRDRGRFIVVRPAAAAGAALLPGQETSP